MTPSLRRGRAWARRPELGAVGGLVLILLLFLAVAPDSGMFGALGVGSILQVAAELALLAAPVALLMVAGEFDLSVGSMVAFAGMILALGVRELGLTGWSAALLALAVAIGVGLLNGWLVVRTRLPSFIVTLASLFILRGLTLGGTRALTGRTVVGELKPLVSGDPAAALFSGYVLEPVLTVLAGVGAVAVRTDGRPELPGVPVAVPWALAAVLGFAFVLHRTRFGNWAFAVGGDARAARAVGVPVDRVKILCFAATALGAALLACLQVFETGSADTNRGLRDEFEAIIAAVIGGTLLSGGHGSVIGAGIGALLFGTVQMGIFYTGVDTDWFQVFLGGMLLAAVAFNDGLRRRLLAAPGPSGGETEGPEDLDDSAETGDVGPVVAPGPPVLEARGISMRFGPVRALEHVDLSLRRGEVHAILGDNGAGKSTLIGVLGGAYAPTAGTLRIDDEEVRLRSPREALALGIATVHQELALAPLMSVSRNFVLGREPTTGRLLPRLDLRTARDRARASVATLGVILDDPDRAVGAFSGGQRQSVAIARALDVGARVLILDEPTSALGVHQSSLVLGAARRAADAGIAVVLITHDVDHAWAIADRFTLLERGRIRGSFARAETNREQVLEAMAGGRRLVLPPRPPAP